MFVPQLSNEVEKLICGCWCCWCWTCCCGCCPPQCQVNIASANTSSPCGRGRRRSRSPGYTTTEKAFQFKRTFQNLCIPVDQAHFSSLLFHEAPVHFHSWMCSASWTPVWTSTRKKISLQTCTHRFTFSLRFVIQLLLFQKVESDGGPFFKVI